ncbi:Protein CBG26944 [Caenorhabditis briggsae]|uniref:C-type lectin domain-containing protein n=2 Tax=Caenorhabditis briggsae TaxID=6238 RepID=A0AAE9A236_CAEBR|nr:Protein CBG26944 [Caenorhabditis briggsae]ULT87133.1 hypothetical protein L3Y34_006723 [Caenorhabditis briggsae]CAR99467.1 Protein CBG26944 [Caenorhabditis briggsae]
MKIQSLLAVVFLVDQGQIVHAVCQFKPFQGLNYALLSSNSDWDASKSACIACGAQMMGMPSGANKTFVEQIFGVNTVAWDTAWVNIRNDDWCSFYTFKSGGKQFSGTACNGSAKYVLCVK